MLAVSDDSVDIGLQPPKDGAGKIPAERERGDHRGQKHAVGLSLLAAGRKTAKSPEGVLSAGDVVYVERLGDEARVPTGFVSRRRSRAVSWPWIRRPVAFSPMVGGFSYAPVGVQPRDPGDAPAGIVLQAVRLRGGHGQRLYAGLGRLDATILSIQTGNGQVWAPDNYEGEGGGAITLRFAIEHSRNLMTVRLANDLGMNVVAEYAERFGIYDHMMPVLAMSLGSGETTVLRMVSAYSVIANGGKQIKPTLIDRIQDRYGTHHLQA